MTTLTPLYDPSKGQMQVAGFMSGSGSNLVEIIRHERKLQYEGESPYHVSLIFSENPRSNAEAIAEKAGIPVFRRDMKRFYDRLRKPIKDMDVRRRFDEGTAAVLKQEKIDAIAYTGYMKIVTKPLFGSFLGVNVHPADLSVMHNGKRAYTGDKAVQKAIDCGERYLRATTHIMEEEVDGGRILMISAPVMVDRNLSYDENQERLKRERGWMIFPKTLEWIANGRYAQDESGNLYFDGKPIPQGVKIR